MPKAIFSVFVVALSVGAFAQDKFDFDTADFSLLLADEIKKELKVSQAQRDKMNTHSKAYNDFGKVIQGKLEKNQQLTDADRKKLAQLREDLRKKILRELNPTQLRRLREITLQQMGLIALTSDQVMARLKMTATQRKNMAQTIESGLKRSSKLMEDSQARLEKEFGTKKPKNDAERKKLEAEFKKRLDSEMAKVRPQVEKIAMDTEKKALSILSATQRKQWADLLGKRFAPK